MFDPFAQYEKHLGRAGLAFVLVVLSAVAAGVVLSHLGFDPAMASLLAWAAMPIVAWPMSRAAKIQGKNPWLYGFGSLLPPLAIFLFLSLSTHDLAMRFAEEPRQDA